MTRDGDSTIDLPGASVSGSWLSEHLDRVVVADVRWSLQQGPMRDAYDHGHIPGAVFVDLDVDLSDPAGHRGRHPLPPVERFLDRMKRLGLLDRPVVAYDDQSGAVAARLWWMLTTLGYPAAVLDGGLAAWPGPLEVSDDVAAPEPTSSANNPAGSDQEGSGHGPAPGEASTSEHGDPSAVDLGWPGAAVVEINDVLGEIATGGTLIDARSADRFAGTADSIDRRPGHVPGSKSRPWSENIGDDGRLRPPDQLRAEFMALGAGAGGWMASCGSGVTGCHNLWAAAVAGLEPGRLFPGSWSQWTFDDSRPVEVDDQSER